MALIDNQTYKKKVSFVSSCEGADNDRVVINLSVICNHEIPKDILTSIESHINSLFISNYITEEEYKEKEKQQKDNEKLKEKLEKENEKLRKENEKMQQKNKRNMRKSKRNNQKKSQRSRRVP